jgi:hypothetical protein
MHQWIELNGGGGGGGGKEHRTYSCASCSTVELWYPINAEVTKLRKEQIRACYTAVRLRCVCYVASEHTEFLLCIRRHSWP